MAGCRLLSLCWLLTDLKDQNIIHTAEEYKKSIFLTSAFAWKGKEGLKNFGRLSTRYRYNREWIRDAGEQAVSIAVPAVSMLCHTTGNLYSLPETAAASDKILSVTKEAKVAALLG